MDRIVTHIAKSPLFSGLPEVQLEKLAGIAQPKRFGKGEPVFSDGQEADGFYVVAEGRVKVFKLSLEGKEQILHIFGPGEPVGEVPVFTGERFPANADALDNSLLLFFPRDAFVRLLEGNISLVMNMLGLLAKRLRRFAAQVEGLSLKEVPGRLAAYLLLLSSEQEGSRSVRLNMSKAQLASLLGTAPETLSRIFAKMRDAALIEVDGPTITILDPEGVKLLADEGKL